MTESEEVCEAVREEKEAGGGIAAVLLVGKCLVRETGNATTLRRLSRHVESGGWRSVTYDPSMLPDVAALQNQVKRHSVVAVLAIHAYRSARVLHACTELGIPYILCFGGTDINEFVKEEEKLAVMTRAVQGARHLLAFHHGLRDAALSTWPFLDPATVSVLPQAVDVDPCCHFDLEHYLETIETKLNNKYKENGDKFRIPGDSAPINEAEHSLPFNNTITKIQKENANSHPAHGTLSQCDPVAADPVMLESVAHITELREEFHPLLLIVAGLRPVKDVLFVARAWEQWWAARGGRGRLLILGPELDPQYSAYVTTAAQRLGGVRVCGSLPPRQCQALIRGATALVNTSHSEGMCGTILEAMRLGTPVLARDNPGNSSLIRHQETGLLFSSPDTFVQALEAVLEEAGLRARLVAAARQWVQRHHSAHAERAALLNILTHLTHH